MKWKSDTFQLAWVVPSWLNVLNSTYSYVKNTYNNYIDFNIITLDWDICILKKICISRLLTSSNIKIYHCYAGLLICRNLDKYFCDCFYEEQEVEVRWSESKLSKHQTQSHWPNSYLTNATKIRICLLNFSLFRGGGGNVTDDGVGGEGGAPPRHFEKGRDRGGGRLRQNGVVSSQHRRRSQRRHSPPPRPLQTQLRPPH